MADLSDFFPFDLASYSPLDDADRAAIVTRNQFQALGEHGRQYMHDLERLRAYCATLTKRRDPRRIDQDRVRNLCVNAWNTECLLRLTLDKFAGPDQGFVVQWAFPQAYYSAFNSTLASFAVTGFTETSHAAVRKKVAEMAQDGGLPEGLNVYATGARKSLAVHGITSTHDDFHAMGYKEGNEECRKAHIIAYMKSTREMYLKEKRTDPNMAKRFKTKKGEIKQSLTQDDWEVVSGAIKSTSWLDLLYRKRVKANYRDIDTFLSTEFRADIVLSGLKDFMVAFNLINEINILNNLGDSVLDWIPKGGDKVLTRISTLLERVIPAAA